MKGSGVLGQRCGWGWIHDCVCSPCVLWVEVFVGENGGWGWWRFMEIPFSIIVSKEINEFCLWWKVCFKIEIEMHTLLHIAHTF